MTEIIDRPKVFYPGERTAKDVREILQSPLPPSHVLQTRYDDRIYDNSLIAPNRVPTDLEPGLRFYAGGWYPQEGPTCTPYSILNGGKVARASINPHLAAVLINIAKGMGREHEVLPTGNVSVKLGMDFGEAAEIAQSFGSSAGVALEEMHYEKSLRRSERPITLNECTTPVDQDRSTRLFDINLYDIFDGKSEPNAIQHNAKVVAEAVRPGQVILAAVRTAKFWGADFLDDSSRHAVSIVGYHISEQTFMDLQVIDPDSGIRWISLEHLSGCLRWRNSYVLRAV